MRFRIKYFLIGLLFALPFVIPAVYKVYREQEYRKKVFAYARECSRTTSEKTFGDVPVKIRPGIALYIVEMTNTQTWQIFDSAHEIPFTGTGELIIAAGRYDPTDGSVTLPEGFRFDPRALTHEYLHALGYFHEDAAFDRCGVKYISVQ